MLSGGRRGMRLPPLDFVLARMLLYAWHEHKQTDETMFSAPPFDGGNGRLPLGRESIAVRHEGVR